MLNYYKNFFNIYNQGIVIKNELPKMQKFNSPRYKALNDRITTRSFILFEISQNCGS